MVLGFTVIRGKEIVHNIEIRGKEIVHNIELLKWIQHRGKVMVKKMGAEIRRADVKLEKMRESMEVAIKAISKLLEEVESMRKDVAALERTRKNVEKAMNDMEEQAMLEESFREEFSFSLEEEELEGTGATEDATIEEEEVVQDKEKQEKSETVMEVTDD